MSDLERYLDGFDDGLIMIDADQRVTYINAAAARLLGCEARTARSKPANAVLPARFLDLLQNPPVDAHSAAEHRIVPSDEGPSGRPLECRIQRDESGALLRIRAAPRPEGWDRRNPATMRWASGRESHLERALHESETKFRGFLEQLRSGVYVLSGGVLTYVNPYGGRIFGYQAQELVGQAHLSDLIFPEDRPALLALIDRCLTGEVPQESLTLRGLRKDGSVNEIEALGMRTGPDRSPVFIGIITDVTERRLTEASLREREEQLRHAQRLEAVGRLAGGIAHDFNNLLMVIKGSVHLILMDGRTEASHRAELEQIVRATERGSALTTQLLAFGRKQRLRPKAVDLNNTVEDLSKMIRRVIGADIELRTDLDPQLWPVRVDPGQLEQVLLNLIMNSRDAMPGGGTLTVRARNARLTPDDARQVPYLILPGPYVRLTVEDTGVGMAENVLAQIFEPFFTTKPRDKGSGLGLSTVYGIVKQSGGYIWATSSPGQGATFEVYLPMASGPGIPAVEPLPGELPKGSGTILLVDNEEPVRAVTRRLLEHGGYRVIEAPGGPEAVRLFEELGGEVDLVLTEVVMPHMGGRELAAQLLARKPSVRMLYMSGHVESRTTRRSRSAPRDDDVIQKPFSPERLLERIQRMVDRPPAPGRGGAQAGPS